MRYVLALILLLIAPLALAEEMIARQGGDWVRLTEAPCTNELVTPRLPAGQGDEFQAATAEFQGKLYVACWRTMGNVAFLIYEDGDQGVVPLRELQPALGI